MIIVDWPHYHDYLLSAFKIFFFMFVIGRTIDYSFTIINKKYPNYNKKFFGFYNCLLL